MQPTEQPSNSVVVGHGGRNKAPLSKQKILKILIAAAIALTVIIVGVILGTQLLSKKNDRGAAANINDATGAANITDSGINPMTIKVKKDQPITWTNQDVKSHRLTADHDELPGFDTVEVLNQGDSYTYIFEKSGTFHYYDPADSKTYVGTVIVE